MSGATMQSTPPRRRRWRRIAAGTALLAALALATLVAVDAAREDRMLQTGDLAPDITLPDQDGNPVRLHDVLDEARVVLYFYVADATPG